MRLKQHHAWLFGFTDLAFLLLISLSLIPSAPEDIALHFSLMDVPGVPANPNLTPLQRSDELWELHVYGEKSDIHPAPFKLVGIAMDQGGPKPLYAEYLQKDELLGELQLLRERNFRPVLIPSKTSLSHDFLFAAGTIARVWDSAQSKTIVKPFNPDEEYQE
jgi:hypothetical protein